MSKFPFSHQHDAMQCGIACLKMICKAYGAEYSYRQIETLCPPTSDGVSMLGLSRAAEQLGFQTICGRMTITGLSEIPLPCILHWKQNHFVVLYRIKKRHGKSVYYIADPGKGLLKYSEKEIADGWLCATLWDEQGKGMVMLMNATPFIGKQNIGGTAEESRSLKYLFGYILKYKLYFGHISIGLALGCAVQILLPFLTQSIVDKGISNKDIGLIWLILIGQLMLTISSSALDFIRRWILLHISVRINISLISDFFTKLFCLPMSFFDTKHSGDILQRIDDHERVQGFLTGQVLTILFSVLTFIVFGTMLLLYRYTIFFMFLSFCIVYAIWITLFLRRRRILDYENFEKEAECQDKTWQMVTSMQAIKLQNCRQRRKREWEKVKTDLFHVQMEGLKLQQMESAGSILINSIRNIIITVMCAMAVVNGQMTLGMMLAVQYIIGQMAIPFEQILSFVYSLQDIKISLERINEIHNAKSENKISGNVKHITGSRDIHIEDVCFSYDKNAPEPTLSNINIDIEEGKMTAIVGMSGSGKTTLLKLLLKYYHASSGEIKVGNLNINEYNPDWWRSQCGIVMQEGVIFSESIGRNIAVDDGDIDTKRLSEAAKIAHIDDFINNLPLKYDTIIGHNGMGISTGQKQRILIARAIYKRPQYIFFDEATNSLDANNEKAIVEDLSEFFRDRTVLVIAHRLSTIRNADRIIVMDKGRVVENGTHHDLLTHKGVYYKLIRSQMEI